MVNTMRPDRLQATMEHILAHPEEHRQEYWAVRWTCGTAGCFAARTVLLEHPDAKFIFTRGDLEPRELEATSRCLINGERYDIGAVATSLLGLGTYDAGALFDSENSVDDLQLMVTTLINFATAHGYDKNYDHVLVEED